MSNTDLILVIACAILCSGGDNLIALGKGKAMMPGYPTLEQGWRGHVTPRRQKFVFDRVSPSPLGVSALLWASSRRGADGIC